MRLTKAIIEPVILALLALSGAKFSSPAAGTWQDTICTQRFI
jgi:hypothetical protein